jgi:pimeloyl-ACP methyl ester carboxylesterase
LVDQGITPAQITVIGHSMGGSTALYAASEYPDLKKLVLVGTFYSIQAMCETQFSILCVMTSGVLNSSNSAPLVQVKTRQFHNPNDQVVPYTQGKNLFNLIASKDKKFSDLSGSGPDFHNSFSVAEILVD